MHLRLPGAELPGSSAGARDPGAVELAARFVSPPYRPKGGPGKRHPAGPVDLVLRNQKLRKLEGRVVSETGLPVAGAKLFVDCLDSKIPFGRVTHSGVGGGFQVEVPENADALQITVLPPGFSLRAFTVDPRSEPVELVVTEVSGTIEIWDEHSESTLDRQTYVLQDGRFLQRCTSGLPAMA